MITIDWKKLLKRDKPKAMRSRWMSGLTGFFGMFFYGGVIGCVIAAGAIAYFSRDLPNHDQLANYEPPIVTRLYAANGQMLAEYATQKRIFVPLTAIPEKLQKAFIAAEDKDFYDHPGVDLMGIARAVNKNIKNIGTGRGLVGGSTITQQVVKNFLLTNEKSFERKIKEALLAFRISKVYSKDKVLELYLNEIYLGRGSYGVAAAALNYFAKPLSELTVDEMAFLAALPQRPADLDPTKNYERAESRRNYVLRRMQEDGYIDAEQMDVAMAAPIELGLSDDSNLARGDFFAEEVRRWLASEYGSNVLYQGGLTVHTTLKPKLQNFAEDALRNALLEYDKRHGYRGAVGALAGLENWHEELIAYAEKKQFPLYKGESVAVMLATTDKEATIGLLSGDEAKIALADVKWARRDLGVAGRGSSVKKISDVFAKSEIILVKEKDKAKGQYTLHQIPKANGAMVAMDPHTGKVLAMVGGYSYARSEFNRATQAKRQPGSALKPFVYMSAFENGFTPNTVVMDGEIEIEQGGGQPVWRPQNYGGDYLGPTTLRMGLEKSRNTMTVRLAQMLGLGRITRLLERFDVYDNPRKLYSMVLGAQETTLMNVATAYAMTVNGGLKVEPALIERIDDRNGKVVYRRDMRKCIGCHVDFTSPRVVSTPPKLSDDRERVVDERVAYQVVSLLEGVVQRGTGTKAKAVGRPVGGKTGTTNDSRDAWFMGFSPDLVAGVYIGYDNPRTLGNKETGGKAALPAFVDFMQNALKDTPARAFQVPPGIQKVRVDRQTGRPAYEVAYEGAQIITESFISDYGSVFRPDAYVQQEGEEPAIIYADEEALQELEMRALEEAGDYNQPYAAPNPNMQHIPNYQVEQNQLPSDFGAIRSPEGYPSQYDPRRRFRRQPVENNQPIQQPHYVPPSPAPRGESDAAGTGGFY